jgi:undecaprenyl pyrophosphate synthase
MDMLFRKKEQPIEEKILPQHIAIVMDGNGRWAKKRSLPRSAGHVAGAKTFKDIARYCNKIGIRYLTVYAFSTENWKRPKEEVDGIMNLLREYLKDATNFKSENIISYDWGGCDWNLENISGIDNFKLSFGGEKVTYYTEQVLVSLKAKLYTKVMSLCKKKNT